MSIQTEIIRILDAKQTLIDWLTDHDVEVSFTAKIDELVELLDSASIGGGSADSDTVPVKIMNSTGISITGRTFPPGANTTGTVESDGTAYNIPANSMMVIRAQATTGGTTRLTAYVTAVATGGLTAETVYQTYSTTSSNLPITITAIKTGSTGGTVTFTRKTSSGTVA